MRVLENTTEQGVQQHPVRGKRRGPAHGSKLRFVVLAVVMAVVASFIPVATGTADASDNRRATAPAATAVAEGDVSNDASPPTEPVATGVAEGDVSNQVVPPAELVAAGVADRAIDNATDAPQICWDLYGEIMELVMWLVALGDSPWADLQRLWYAQDVETLLNQYDLLNCGDYSDMPGLPPGL